MKAALIAAVHADGAVRFAAWDEATHHVAGEIAASRLAAWLRPFRSEAEAREAIEAAGCQIERGNG